ncbi:MAG: metallopeptidase family protein [Dehalococcoidia bacterium]|nr:metallopeptidase family protein [Dehalococcoidia bacterium]MDW8119197.1 metallopeptidase family protein [Chloroflexota bacterium]
MPVRLSRRAFRRLVQQAIAALPPPVLAYLDNVDILVQDWPTPQQLRSVGADSPYDLLGLYEGIPQTERGFYTLVLPDRITLFQRPIEAVCTTIEEMAHQVRTTILHELAHHYGWKDADMQRLGLA